MPPCATPDIRERFDEVLSPILTLWNLPVKKDLIPTKCDFYYSLRKMKINFTFLVMSRINLNYR